MNLTIAQAAGILDIGTSLLRWRIRHQHVLMIVGYSPAKVTLSDVLRWREHGSNGDDFKVNA